MVNQFKPMETLSNFKEIKLDHPVDIIISQIRDLIITGELNAGDKLPPERKLSEKFGISRTYVRDAIKKLEFYGIVKTHPQSGTIIAGLGVTALEGLITDVLKMEGSDFHSLIETRLILESQTVKLAAKRRTEEDIVALQEALNLYEAKVKSGEQAIDEDLLFHIKIAEASKNNVLKSLMLVVTPDILNHFTKHNVCGGGKPFGALQEHKEILAHIIEQDGALAEKAMNNHLSDIINKK
ncbi:GntR family transcriptional repressor for pyruvate dehydrogenase complex [Algoriphagus chordae]|uniref:GntR family transcriptional repressor for pyruvate dehydrogenase complex n=2 Tax=Algoriphagus chordae TaxID=237019 RepID=A0A2W7RGG9_9BACT|nr:GntR family transcriptional repressor for pyruvate dehydrogenase complex [Algoriphagus chordae]